MKEPLTTAFAAEIAEKASEQVKLLIGRNWPEISRILEKDEEIKLTFGSTITNRDAEAGTQADKDHRIKTTVSFSEKHSDVIEAALDDPSQPELFDGDEVQSEQAPHIEREPAQSAESQAAQQPVQQAAKEVPAWVGQTPVGQALHEAAAGKELPIVNITIDAGYTVERARTQFRKAARKIGWNEAALDIMDEALLACRDDMQQALLILSAHTLTPRPQAA